jgi:23S rRNA pseudouridine1911/1915/1917 synthase
VLSQGDQSGKPSLVDYISEYLKDRYGKKGNVYVGLVHRLDRLASGLMVVGKTSKATSRLAQSFRSNSANAKKLLSEAGNAKSQDNIIIYNKVSGLQKEYVCVVKGLLKGDNVTCFSSIEKDALGFSKISFSDLHNTSNNNIVKNGLSFASKESIALLTYSHVAYNDSLDVTLVRVLLISGRKHQIRLQMSQMGHEIFGDEKYGFDKRRCQHIDFIALHSHRLTLQHPVKKDIVRFRLNIILK